MRVFVAVIALGHAMSSALGAQYVGISGGLAVSTVDWQYPAPPPGCDTCVGDASPSASRQSATPALMVQWRAHRWLGVSTEMRLAPKGFARTEPTLHVDYLQVPLLIRVGQLTGQQAGVRPFVEAGPAVALRVRCRVSFGNTSDGCVEGAVLGLQDWRIRRLDFSGQAGVGLAVRVRRALVLVGSRAEWGWSDIGGPEPFPTKHWAVTWYVGGLAEF